jgi:hypothetical protein
MAHPIEHAKSSAKKLGGVPEDYQKIHDFFDESKSYVADFRHRARYVIAGPAHTYKDTVQGNDGIPRGRSARDLTHFRVGVTQVVSDELPTT